MSLRQGKGAEVIKGMNLSSQRRKTAKSKDLELKNTRIKLKEKYYSDLENLHEQYDIFLHDIKHTMRTIAALSEEGNCKEIGRLIEKMQTTLGIIDDQIICSHKILNALLAERRAYADENGVVLDLEIREPLYLQQIDDLDLIALMGNLLDNAIEAEIHSGKRAGILCNMHMSNNSRHMVIQIENSFEEKRRSDTEAIKPQGSLKENADNLQRNIGKKHGIGLKSVNEVVRKYGGIFESDQSKGRYNVKIILPVQGEWSKDASYTESIPVEIG